MATRQAYAKIEKMRRVPNVMKRSGIDKKPGGFRWRLNPGGLDRESYEGQIKHGSLGNGTDYHITKLVWPSGKITKKTVIICNGKTYSKEKGIKRVTVIAKGRKRTRKIAKMPKQY